MAIKYIDTSATYNGDGTSPDQATSDGGVGAYNNIPSFYAGGAAGDIGLCRRLNIGASYTVSATITAEVDGTQSDPILLVGYPISRSVTDVAISAVGVYSTYNDARCSFATTDATIGNSADHDHNWDGAIVTFHQSGSANDGLERMVIKSEWDSSNSRMKILFFPDLPEDLTTSATVDFQMDTWTSDEIPSVSAWDSDTNNRFVVDGTSLTSSFVFDFLGDHYNGLVNCYVKAGYRAVDGISCSADCVYEAPDSIFRYFRYDASLFGFDKLFLNSDTYPIYSSYRNNPDIRSSHYFGSRFLNGSELTRYKNCSFGRDVASTAYLDIYPEISLNNCYFTFSGVYGRDAAGEVVISNSVVNQAFRDLYRVTYFTRSYSITSADSSYWAAPPSGASKEMVIFPIRSDIADDDTYYSLFPAFSIVRKLDVSDTSVSVTIRPSGWSSTLTDQQVFIKVSIHGYSGGFAYTSEGDGSTTFANDTWSTITISGIDVPAEQLVEVEVYLKAYDSGAYVLVDVE